MFYQDVPRRRGGLEAVILLPPSHISPARGASSHHLAVRSQMTPEEAVWAIAHAGSKVFPAVAGQSALRPVACPKSALWIFRPGPAAGIITSLSIDASICLPRSLALARNCIMSRLMAQARLFQLSVGGRSQFPGGRHLGNPGSARVSCRG